jgi:hypothetical protein
LNDSPQTKLCPDCNAELPLEEFGICKARSDGRNLYCKTHCRKRVYDFRARRRDYNATRKRLAAEAKRNMEAAAKAIKPAAPIILSRNEKVLRAVKDGCRTLGEIGNATKLYKEDLYDALTLLLLDTREIATEMDGNTRVYFPRVQFQVPPQSFQPAQSFTQLLIGSLGPRRNTRGSRR